VMQIIMNVESDDMEKLQGGELVLSFSTAEEMMHRQSMIQKNEADLENLTQALNKKCANQDKA